MSNKVFTGETKPSFTILFPQKLSNSFWSYKYRDLWRLFCWWEYTQNHWVL